MTTDINLSFTIPKELDGQRLDAALAKLLPEYSRARIQTWIKDQMVEVNHQQRRPKDKVFENENINIKATLPANHTWQAQEIPLNIVYQDEDIIVINKPVNFVVHPGAGNTDNTLLNALIHHFPELTQVPRAGIVHRIDKDTSGLLVVARNLIAHNSLVEQLQTKTMYREYEAIVCGVMTAGGCVDAPIGRDPKHRTRMAVVHSGKEAITHYRVIERFQNHTLIQVQLETGRTHQIRVHMAHIHYPLVGDKLYGGRFKIPKNATPELIELLREFPRQALHAKRLGLIHPQTDEALQWEAELPQDMAELIQQLRTHKNQQG